MALYRYEAVTPSGDILRGELDAQDQAAVVAHLHERGQMPIRAEPAGVQLFTWKRRAAPRLSRNQLAVFTRELASLLHAGLALDRALQVILEVTEDPRARKLVAAIQEAVRGGAALSAALEAQASSFSRFYVSMIRAAEAAGTLDAGFARLAEHEERNKALRDSVVSALIYPGILVSVAAVSLLIILAYVVPQFTQLFADAGRALPLSTQIVIGVAALLRDYWWLLAAGVAAAAFLARLQLAKPRGRYWLDGILLGLPVVGELVKRIEMARFSRSLGTLLACGVALLAALSIVKEVLANRALAAALDPAAEALKAGGRLADALLAGAPLPRLGLQMIKVGEETGRLDEMLLKVAELYEREVTGATARLLAVLEPLLIVGLGIVIAAVILSLLQAIVSVNDLPL
jgi:general secretion pathway protein F